MSVLEFKIKHPLCDFNFIFFIIKIWNSKLVLRPTEILTKKYYLRLKVRLIVYQTYCRSDGSCKTSTLTGLRAAPKRKKRCIETARDPVTMPIRAANKFPMLSAVV